MSTDTIIPTDPREALVERLVDGMLAGLEVLTVHVGLQTGLYRALVDGASSAAELAERTGLDARYVVEWLEQQAVAGLIDVDDAGAPAFNRPMVTSDLASTWLPALGDLHGHLVDTTAARILDVGCGVGWTTIELARAYPQAVVRGIDLDADSVATARKHAAEAGVADRVSFTLADGATFDATETFDLVTCFETLHDMGDPVGTLRTARRLLAPGGRVLIGDDRGADAFDVPGEPYERLLYAFSVLHCLPATRAEEPVHAHGTVVRPADMLRWIEAAGFGAGDVLDIDNDM